MHRILPLIFCLAALTSCDNAGKPAQKPPEGPPNIILILTDDLGYGDLSCYGSPRVRTAHLDLMASEGMKMTSFYAFPSCSPSRAALLTGCYPPRVGIPDVVGPPGPHWTADKQNGLHPNETTLPEVLKTAGYATAMVGKWHLGHFPETMPTRQGFDQFFGLPYSNDMLPEQGYPDLILLRNTDTLERNPDQHLLTGRYTEEALAFMRAKRDSPFFLYVAHSMPHVPIFASEAFDGRSGQGLYADVVGEIDGSVGRILAELKALGIDDNTLVIFTSDNGPWLTYGNHAGSAGPFREGKGTTWEGGMRVPMIVRWPDRIPAAVVSHTPASLTDILPTLAAITKAELPEKKLDGRDLTAHFTHLMAPAAAPMCYYRSGNLDAVRVGKWKLHRSHNFRFVKEVGDDGVRGKYDYVDTGVELYDLQGDPGEIYNVADKFPEKVAELEALGARLQAEMDAEKRPAFRAGK
ncbi:sulfatase family protein [Neolewinella agarilytica]|uniref:Arylsulfatase n=1 Tax=Neolewinella agarilytica TaxID=478744 RepID=A0A1H9ASN2_9BACT|nr:sulfatase [Neolewinella agarilytica]SEP79710.1 arylsulfatase [Neolewinella agarilytica]